MFLYMFGAPLAHPERDLAWDTPVRGGGAGWATCDRA